MDSQWQEITKKKTTKTKHKKHIGISTLHVHVLKENIHIYTCTQMNTHVIKWSTGMREKKIMMYTSHGIKYIVLIIKQIVIFIVSTQKKIMTF